MSLNADNQIIDLSVMLEFLRTQAQSMPSEQTRTRYLRALDLFSAFIDSNYGREVSNFPHTSAPSHLQYLDSGLLVDWLVSQWLSSTPYNTASLYLDIISSLYGACAKAGKLPPTKVFSEIKGRLKSLGRDSWDRGIDEEVFARALRLTKNAAHCLSDDAIAADMVLWSLTHGCMPIMEVAMLIRDDVNPDNSEETAIAGRQLGKSRRKYLFSLHQSDLTPRQLEKKVRRIIQDLFRRTRLPISDRIDDTIESLWAYAALSSGVSPTGILLRFGRVPLGLPILKLAESSDSSYGREVSNFPTPHANTDPKDPRLPANSGLRNPDSFNAIGKIFIDNPLRWYAMSLRPGVRFTQLARRIEILGDTVPHVELFYPSEEIVRHIGKKLVVCQRPFISRVVFFRTRLTDIYRLFSRIGDLAWCYRLNGHPGAPYAEISQHQFDLFQQTIACFTPDFEVAESGEFQLKPNDRVKVIGGLFTGIEADIESLVTRKPEALSLKTPQSQDSRPTTEDTHIVYRLNLIGDNGIDWRITVDPRLLQPS